LIEIGMKEC